MKKYPVHSVHDMPALGLYDLSQPTIQLSTMGAALEILEYSQADHGRQSYMIVQTHVEQNGAPHYSAYTNNEFLKKQLMERMSETYQMIHDAEINAGIQNHLAQSQSVPTIKDALALKHAQSERNNSMYHAALTSNDCHFRVARNVNGEMGYIPCDFSDIKIGDDVMVFGTTRDVENGQTRFEWRGIEVGALDVVEENYMLEGFEFEHSSDGAKRYLGPCNFSNIDYSTELSIVNNIGLDRAMDMMQSGISLMEAQIVQDNSWHCKDEWDPIIS